MKYSNYLYFSFGERAVENHSIAEGKNDMQLLTQQTVNCPYCGESIEVLIDREEAGQQYIEDCQVCCRPITFNVAIDFEDQVSVTVYDENESF